LAKVPVLLSVIDLAQKMTVFLACFHYFEKIKGGL
jgi:hypothetical protein